MKDLNDTGLEKLILEQLEEKPDAYAGKYGVEVNGNDAAESNTEHKESKTNKGQHLVTISGESLGGITMSALIVFGVSFAALAAYALLIREANLDFLAFGFMLIPAYCFSKAMSTFRKDRLLRGKISEGLKEILTARYGKEKHFDIKTLTGNILYLSADKVLTADVNGEKLNFSVEKVPSTENEVKFFVKYSQSN